MMKKNLFRFLVLMLAASLAFTSCKKNHIVDPDPEPNPMEGMHFDIWTPLGDISGMGVLNCLVKRTTSLDNGELDFTGTGVDLSEKLYPHTIIKDKYYYQITKDGKFGKYQITDNQLITVKEFPFSALKGRRFCHAWIEENTLLLMGANGKSDKILWTKVNTETMTEMGNGELDLPAPQKGEVINTSGMAAYRKADNKILYAYHYKPAKTKPLSAPRRTEFYMAFINPADMSIIKTVTEKRADFMAATAYGELLQNKSFFDEKGDYYIACNSRLPECPESSDTQQHGFIFRIKSGAMEFDASYNGYPRERGKIITITYLNNGKAVLYMQDPQYATPENPEWSSSKNPYVFYWVVNDLNTQTVTDLKDIPFSNGNFAQLALTVGKKAYLGTNPKEGKSCIYVYDIPSGKVSKGMTLADGFLIERMVWLEN